MCRFWDFGVQNVMQDLFRDEGFASSCFSWRNYENQTTFPGSSAFRELDRRCYGSLGPNRESGKPVTTMWEIGGDGVSLLNFGARSATA
jgi:hypothetical protein